ncbi:MAG TPA: SRPBCC domain-containing protein [Friedmanniella sp.]
MLDRPPGALAHEVAARHDVAMDLTHRVRVPAPLDEAWAVVLDPARVAAVLPGSTVDAATDDTFSGTMKIKLGSSLLALAGDGRYVARDDAAHRVVVTTDAADRRGDAGVEARHTITLTGVGAGRAETDVTVRTSMTWSGRPSRLGDGVVADAVDRVLEVTATRIAARVAEGLPWVPAAGAETARDDALTAAAVVDHPVELGADLGGIDEASATGRPSPAPSPSPGPSARPPTPRPAEYVYQPYSNTAEPHVSAVKTLTRVVGGRVLPYAGLGALALFVAASAVRRARR